MCCRMLTYFLEYGCKFQVYQAGEMGELKKNKMEENVEKLGVWMRVFKFIYLVRWRAR